MNLQEEIDQKVNAIIEKMLNAARLTTSEKESTKELLADFKKSIHENKQNSLDQIEQLALQEQQLQEDLDSSLGENLKEDLSRKIELDIETHFSMNFDTVVNEKSATILKFRPRNS